ncbi:MAG: hypothetical protein ACOYN3_00690 [Acidimicrobiia bacterium]
MTAVETESVSRGVDFRRTLIPAVVSRLVCAIFILGTASWGKSWTWFGFSKWDGDWYTRIAQLGYHAPPVEGGQTPWPFFPLFPMILRAFYVVGINERLTGVLLSNVLFWVALAGVHRIARKHVSASATTYAVWALALFPSSFVFSMLYPSSLFLAASVWAFVWIEERRDFPAGIAVLAAAMVRPNGAVVAVAAVVALWRTPRRVAIVIGPAVAVVVLWMAYCWQQTGDPIIFLTAKSGWAEVSIVDALTGGMKWAALPHLVMAIAAMGVVAWKRRRLPLSWSVLTVLQLVPSLVLGMVGLARYANECFPPFVAAGEVLAEVRRPLRIAAFVLAVVGLFLFTLAVIRYSLVP